MISHLSGTILETIGNSIIIDVNGVGYSVVIPKRIQESLSKKGQEVNLFIYTEINMRDGKFVMFGFTSAQELRFFELLLTVSGIGPKNAQNILSSLDLETLQLAIINGDDQYLRKISGIGGKTAQRIILELKAKVMSEGMGSVGERNLTLESEAIDALVSLGYSAYQSRDALKEVSKKAKTTEDRIKEALKILGRHSQ